MKSFLLQSIPQLDYATNEAINVLATNVLFSGADKKAIMVTSCRPNEGKSTLTFQLASRMANLGYSVMLIDADIRKSTFAIRYNITAAEPLRGLSHYLAGLCTREDIEYTTNIPNLHMIIAGKEVVNSLPLLNSTGFVDLIHSLRKQYDFVFVDTPPVNVIVDAAIIATVCDGTLVVVANEQVSKRELKSAVQLIKKSGSEILGIVLNKVSIETQKSRMYYHSSYYSHYYGSEDGHGANQSTENNRAKR